MNQVGKVISVCSFLFFTATFALGQGHQCPIEAVKVVPHVYTFRQFGPEQNGWRPFNVMAIDLMVGNVSDKNIGVMWFNFMTTSTEASWDGVHATVNPGQRVSVYFDNYGHFMNLSPMPVKDVRVFLTKIQYANGMVVDLNCDLGTTPLPPPFQPPKALPDSPVYSVGGNVSPPRVLESHLPQAPPPPKPNWRGRIPPESAQTVVFSIVVGEDGEPRDFKVKESTLDNAMIDKAKQALSKWYFAPAVKDDKPVAVRIEVSFTLVHTRQGGVGWGASRPYGQNN
jgi:TonB family protein